MPTRLVEIVVDAADPPALARFWASALGWPVTYEDPDEWVVGPPSDDPAQQGQLPLVFGPPINDAKTAKDRVHLDLASSSAEHQSEVVARIEALGGRRVDIGQGDVTWFVMADPEDNELCVVSHAGSVGKDPASVRRHQPRRRGRLRLRRPRTDRPSGRRPPDGRSSATTTKVCGSVTPRTVGPTSTSTGSPSRRRPSCGCTSTWRRTRTMTMTPRSSACGPSARPRSTSGSTTSPGWSSPIPRATSSACSHRGTDARPRFVTLLSPPWIS